MTSKQILVVHEDASLRSDLENTLGAKDTMVSLSTTARAKRNIYKHSYAFVIIEAREGWNRDVQRLYRQNGKLKNTTILVAPTSLIQNHSDNLKSLSYAAVANANGHGPAKAQARASEDLCLKDFVERKLRNFVKNMKAGGVRNLYSVILAEVERPMISYILKETNYNQVQAARILGMNRNTLRKKIKDLKISSKQPALTTSRK